MNSTLPKKILITAREVDDLIPFRLKGLGFQVDLLPEPSEEQLQSVIEPYYGLIITTYTRVTAELLKTAKNLSFIGRVGSGLENVDLAATQAMGIAVYSSPEGNANAVGEHTLGLLLSLMNKINTASAEVLRGIWQREENRGEELDGKTVGIIGYGHTGSAFARKLRGFDVQVLACDKYKTGFSNKWVKESRLKKIMQEADVISVHIPMSEENYHFLNDEFFQGLRQSVYLLLTCRGEIYDTQALIRALEAGTVKGAGLDVMEDEPWTKAEKHNRMTYKRLLQNPAVIATPHVAGWTKESKYKLATVLLDKIEQHLSHGSGGIGGGEMVAQQ